jgi:hypothetical protein
MITAGWVRPARVLLGLNQFALAKRSGLFLPTIQSMGASHGVIRGNVDSLVKLTFAPAAGVELIDCNDPGGRGVRLSL